MGSPPTWHRSRCGPPATWTPDPTCGRSGWCSTSCSPRRSRSAGSPVAVPDLHGAAGAARSHAHPAPGRSGRAPAGDRSLPGEGPRTPLRQRARAVHGARPLRPPPLRAVAPKRIATVLGGAPGASATSRVVVGRGPDATGATIAVTGTRPGSGAPMAKGRWILLSAALGVVLGLLAYAVVRGQGAKTVATSVAAEPTESATAPMALVAPIAAEAPVVTAAPSTAVTHDTAAAESSAIRRGYRHRHRRTRRSPPRAPQAAGPGPFGGPKPRPRRSTWRLRRRARWSATSTPRATSTSRRSAHEGLPLRRGPRGRGLSRRRAPGARRRRGLHRGERGGALAAQAREALRVAPAAGDLRRSGLPDRGHGGVRAADRRRQAGAAHARLRGQGPERQRRPRG